MADRAKTDGGIQDMFVLSMPNTKLVVRELRGAIGELNRVEMAPDFRYIKHLEQMVAEDKTGPLGSAYDSVWSSI